MSVKSLVAADLTITALTDSSGGTAGDTIVDVPAAYTEATMANQLASLTTKVNELVVSVAAIRDEIL